MLTLSAVGNANSNAPSAHAPLAALEYRGLERNKQATVTSNSEVCGKNITLEAAPRQRTTARVVPPSVSSTRPGTH
ncbi:hypothetical protein ABH922_003635 [Rhodococcus sp. 27YEA15]